MATYVVGDLQGCCDALQRLLDAIRFDPAADELWCPGDLVNRGGQSLQTLRLLESLDDEFTADADELWADEVSRRAREIDERSVDLVFAETLEERVNARLK